MYRIWGRHAICDGTRPRGRAKSEPMTPIETPNIFAPVSTPAFAIRDLSFIVLAITAAIFVIVGGLASSPSIRFVRRPPNRRVGRARGYAGPQVGWPGPAVPLLTVAVL